MPFRSRLTICFVAIFVIVSPVAVKGHLQAQENATISELDEIYKPVKWRCIGPFRGGRSVCASGVPGSPQTYLMGTT